MRVISWRKMPNPWFSNRGQVIQTIAAVVACLFAGIKVWPDFQSSNLLSLAAILFYCLLILVVVNGVLWWRWKSGRKSKGVARGIQPPPGSAGNQSSDHILLDIVEGLVAVRMVSLLTKEIHVFLRVRVVLLTEPQHTLRDWKLDLYFGKEFLTSLHRNQNTDRHKLMYTISSR